MNIAVFSSGAGTNFAAILKSIKLKQIRNVKIILVSDRPVSLPGESIRNELSIEERNRHGVYWYRTF